MNRKMLVAALVAALAIGLALGGWLAGKRRTESDDTGAAAGARPTQEDGRRILYWYDPMRPDVKFDRPGRSPFMDMELLPRYDDDERADVRVDPSVAQSLGIRVAAVEKAVLTPQLAAVGSVAFDERRLHVVQARVEGYVTRLHVNAPLESVREGQPLAEIQSPAWLAAQGEYLALLDAGSDRSRAIRDAARERLVVLGVPEATIRRIEQTRRTEAATTLFAPAAGVVTELAARQGAAFMPGATLFRINGLDTVWVNAQIPEAQVARVRPGSKVEARAMAWPGTVFEGRVAALLPEIDPATRTLPVRIVVDNPGHRLAPGMFLSLEFEGRPGEPQLVIPSEAVIVTGERSVVIVAREGGGFDVAEVTVGTEADGRTAILSGLAEGQAVVLSGQFLIDSEASLRSAITRLGTQDAAHGAHP